MYRPFLFGVVIANAPSHTAFVTLARRAEELGYTTLLMPDRTITGLAPLTHGMRNEIGGGGESTEGSGARRPGMAPTNG